MFKWFAGSAGVIIGVAHIGVLGHLINQNNLPTFVPPQVGPRSSYTVEATRDGYSITYRGDDPTVMTEEITDSRPGGFLGMGGRQNTTRTRQYTESGQRGASDEGKFSAEEIACIEAAGGGRAQGAIVGGSVASGVVVPAVASIPYVGWLAAGWATLLGTEWGGNMGATAATAIRGC
jgi:hypothetical protein